MSLDPPPEAGEAYVIGAVDRALQLLDLLAEFPNIGVTEIARHMGVSKTLAFRLLHTLERRDYVVRDPDRRAASLGHQLLYLANRTANHSILLRSIRPEIDYLATQLDEDLNIYARTGLVSVCIATRRSSHTGHQVAELGRRGLLHAGGSSSVLLAYAPEAVQQAVLTGELKRFTPQTVIDPRRLWQRIAKIRKEGFWIAKGDVDPAGFSVAAPVFGPGHVVVVSLSVAGILRRLTPKLEAQYLRLVVESAARMSAQLGDAAPITQTGAI